MITENGIELTIHFLSQSSEIMLYYANLLDLLCPQDERGGCHMASFGLSLQTHACK